MTSVLSDLYCASHSVFSVAARRRFGAFRRSRAVAFVDARCTPCSRAVHGSTGLLRRLTSRSTAAATDIQCSNVAS